MPFEGAVSVYETDEFARLLRVAASLCGTTPYGGSFSSHRDQLLRILVDHTRLATIVLADLVGTTQADWNRQTVQGSLWNY